MGVVEVFDPATGTIKPFSNSPMPPGSNLSFYLYQIYSFIQVDLGSIFFVHWAEHTG